MAGARVVLGMGLGCEGSCGGQVRVGTMDQLEKSISPSSGSGLKDYENIQKICS